MKLSVHQHADVTTTNLPFYFIAQSNMQTNMLYSMLLHAAQPSVYFNSQSHPWFQLFMYHSTAKYDAFRSIQKLRGNKKIKKHTFL